MCTYCPAEATTEDHVPPRNLFAAAPAGLVTVPSCEPCNLGASKDDEYFRLAITPRLDVDGHPDAMRAREVVIRSLARPEARGFLMSVLETLREVDLRTPAGLYLGRAGSYVIDPPRLCRVAERTAKGLLYHHLGYRVPAAGAAHTILPSELEPATRERFSKPLGQLLAALCAQTPRFVGRRVLTYWHQAVPAEEPECTISCLIFYDRVGFVTITAPKGSDDNR
jgi:hypothetical protein